MNAPLTLPTLVAALARHDAVVLGDDGGDAAPGRAAVAAIVRQREGGLHLLFIQRATLDGDPWSGHIAFPGGMAEPGDADIRATAIRETLEEIGVDLSPAECIGRLDDLRGRPIPIVVSALVFRLDEEPAFASDHEVEDAFWVNVETLLDPERRTSIVRFRDGVKRPLPAILLPGAEGRTERPPLWGLTYQLVTNLAGIAGRTL